MTESFRLPTNTIPSHYDIRIRPDLESETFEGTVTIRADVQASTDTILLNSDGLEISGAKISTATTTATADIVVNQPDEQVELRLAESLPEGAVSIDLSFSGSFNPQLVGLYASHFQVDGVDHKLATTQFEATHARKCFPCWDEPAYKATFKLDLIVDDQYDAIANSAEQSRTSNGDGTSTISFAPTMKMSTYLVAFVVGPLEKSKVVTAAGVPLRVVHVPGKSELTDFALEVGAFALEYFTEYFGIGYPGDKLDLVAIPDFAFGAMENLGCVTFREVLLLIDPESSTQPEVMRSVDVINHELAHMWFGDLVTMKWWNGLWLNEAFATFMEMKCTEAFRPDWERWVEFGVSRSQAFATDSLVNTRPIEFEVINPEDAEGMFDILTYEKGAAVVRMAEQFLGEAEFQAGIAQYMTDHSYGNTETTDLWDSLQAATGRPVRKMMDSWIFQGGYPAISSRIDDTTLTISQERLLYASDGSDTADSQLWSVPIQYRWLPAGASEPITEWILLEDDFAEVTLPSEPQWVILNANSSSFIRVSRTTEQLDDLADIASDHLTPLERYSLIDDTWAAVLSGSVSTLSFLTLLEAMVGETNRSVWSRIVQGLNQLDRLVDGPAQTGLEDIAHDIVSPALASLGLGPVDGDSDKTKQLRGDLVRAFGITANNKEIQQEAQRAVATEGRNPGTVDVSILAAAVEIVAHCGDEADFDEFTNRWRTAETPQAELRYLGALCDFRDDRLVARLRTRILDGDVRSQNGPYMLRRALMNQEVNAQTWEFIKENWDQLNTQFPTTSIVRMVDGITTLTSEAQLADTTEFFAQHPVTTGQQTLQQILERQEVNVRLVARERQKLSDFLSS